MNTSLFPAAKALKHNKRQEKTKGIEPFTKESPNPQNKTENPATVPYCCLRVRVPRFHCNKAVLTAQAVCTAAVSPTNAFFIYFLLFLFLHLNKKEITTHLFFYFFSTILWFQFTFDLAPVLWWHRRQGVMFRAAETAFQRRGDQGPLVMIFTKGMWTELTEADSRIAALIAPMPWALPLS